MRVFLSVLVAVAISEGVSFNKHKKRNNSNKMKCTTITILLVWPGSRRLVHDLSQRAVPTFSAASEQVDGAR
jgi:hypothetical protein